jgi:hypothetical protein
MNERIDKLFGQALDEAVPETWTTLDADQLSRLKEKFAELIVRECAGICMEMATKCAGLPGDGALARDCADWIKKDFGVQE